MKHKFLLALATFGIACNALYAQLNITLQTPDGTDVTNKEIEYLSPSNSETHLNIAAFNKAGFTVNVKVKKVEKNIISNSENYFCWKDCYVSSVYESPDALPINPNAENDSFKGTYSTTESVGQSTIMYVFFDANSKQKDSVYVTVNYKSTAPLGISDEKQAKGDISISQNPGTNGELSINYSIQKPQGASIKLFNVLGKQVGEVAVKNDQGIIHFSTSNLQSGIYFYSLAAGSQIIKTKKVILAK